MADHDGSFLNTLPIAELSESDMQCAVSGGGDFTSTSAGHCSLTSSTHISHTTDTEQPDGGTQYLDKDMNICKRRHGVGDNHTKLTTKHSKTTRSSMFQPRHIINDVLLSDDSLTELGITGFLPIGDDMEDDLSDMHMYPTPSPSHSSTATAFASRTRYKPECPEILGVKHPEITKNRAITLFDSPEDSKRGWSELGLRLRKPRHLADSCQRTAGEGYFNFIADEIVLSIFKTMPKAILVKCARVCKRWRRLAYDESLWQRLDLGGRVLREGVLGDCVLNRGAEYLRLASAEVLGKVYTGHNSLNACKLRYLDLSMATISIQSLEELFSHCKHIKKLSVETLSLNEHICSLIGQNMMLTTLNCSMATGLNFRGLKKIFSRCMLLDELNLAWIKLKLNDVRSVIANLPRGLLSLNLSGCRELIKDSDVELLVTVCPRLLEIDLSDSLGITDQSLLCIQQGLAHLQSLHLSRCYYIIPDAFRCLELMPKLRTLSVHSMMQEENLQAVKRVLYTIQVNNTLFSTIARPTVGVYRTSIWGHRVRDIPC